MSTVPKDDPSKKSRRDSLMGAANAATSNEAKRTDGRRNNKPPESGKIKPKEVRNPYGRAGKPKPDVQTNFPGVSDYDRFHIAEANRTVTHDPDGPVSAAQRLVREEWFAALRDGDENARIRVLRKFEAISAREAAENRALCDELWETKFRLTEQFEAARRAGKRPPDKAHPDHIIITEHGVRFVGPIEPELRIRQWASMMQASSSMDMHAFGRHGRQA